METLLPRRFFPILTQDRGIVKPRGSKEYAFTQLEHKKSWTKAVGAWSLPNAAPQSGKAHPPQVFDWFNICCPFPTQRAAKDCVGTFHRAPREKIPCMAQGEGEPAPHERVPPPLRTNVPTTPWTCNAARRSARGAGMSRRTAVPPGAGAPTTRDSLAAVG